MCIVIAPILVVGVLLGNGTIFSGVGKTREDLPPVAISAPVVEMEQSAFGEAGPPAEGAQLSAADTTAMRLSGLGAAGELASAQMETTTLSPERAAAEYDARAAGEGWAPDEALSRSMKSPECAALRAYRKGGGLRVVVVGMPVAAGESERPVTIFEGRFGERR